MALPATDSFTTGSDQALTDYSANWTNNTGAFIVYAATDDVESNASGETGAHWNADSFDPDQYAEGVVSNTAAGSYIGPAVRCASGATVTYYGLYYSNNDLYMFKQVGGSWTQLGDTGTGPVVTDVIRLEITGVDPGTLTPLIEGAEEDPPGALEDSDIDSGYAGICGYGVGSESGARLDDWEGGNLGAGISIPVVYHHLQQQGIA